LTAEQARILSQDRTSRWFSLQAITNKTRDTLETVDGASARDQAARFDDDEDGKSMAAMFWDLFSVLKKKDYESELLYVATWLRVLLEQKPTRAKNFYLIGRDPIKPLVEILFRQFSKQQNEILANVSVCCGTIVQNAPGKASKDEYNTLTNFGRWIPQELSKASRLSMNETYLESMVMCLKNALGNVQVMEIICEDSFADIMFKFIIHEKNQNFQVLYLAGFALLKVALKDKMRDVLANHANLAKAIIKIISTNKKEKVQRIYLTVVECLLDAGNFSEMCIMYGLFPVLERLNIQVDFKDEDVKETIDLLIKKLRPQIKVMSSMERYERELKTKTLEWGPVHDEKFWKTNFMRFERAEYALVKDLVRLLESNDPQTVCVAANDLGEFARLYPDGRRLISRFGAKDRFFVLLEESPDESVRKHVLLATQKTLVSKWQSID